MRKLYIDFDGVIYNSIDVSYKMANEKNMKSEKEFYLFYKNLDWQVVLENSCEINNAFSNIKKLCEFYDVSILTHVVSLNEVLEKVNIIRKHLDDINIISVPKSISKTKMVCAMDAILVDDYVQNLIEWKDAGGIGIKFDLDMDGKGFPVIDRLDKVTEILK